MTKIIAYIVFGLLLFVSNVNAQDKSFEAKMKALSTQMDEVITSEKALLKEKIKSIEKIYNKDEISYEEAEKQKKEATELHANNIKTKIASIEKEVHEIVQGKVDVKVKEVEDDDYEIWNIKIKNRSKTIKKNRNRRTRANLVFAMGLNNLMKDGNINSIQDSDFKFGNSHFYEIGLNYKTRLAKNSGLMYFNYGLSLRYNNLRAKNNKFLVVNGNQTNLQTHTMELEDSRFKNVQLVVPIFLEFDFSKSKKEKEKIIFRRNRSFRLGIGAFGGFNIKSKQYVEYTLDGVDTESISKGDYNSNKFVYGLQGLIGYKDTSFYVKYDLQDLFAHSFEKQKNISFGVRFDL